MYDRRFSLRQAGALKGPGGNIDGRWTATIFVENNIHHPSPSSSSATVVVAVAATAAAVITTSSYSSCKNDNK